MIFQLGVLCLFGSMAVTSALPPCVCARNLRPVCGSDGRTYNNECLLNCAQLSNPELVMVSNGRCDGISPEPNCVCTLEYFPVCGTDGRTYPNRCSMNCPRQNPPVEVAFNGQCRNKRDDVQVVDLPQPSCTCPRNFDPVCGTDGATYDNTCVLECISGKNPELRMEHPGYCEKDIPCACTYESNPICGSDGNTYENPCMLKCAKESNKDLVQRHVGECDDKVKVVNSAACICTREGKPVCGTDGNTYGNPCMLNCARLSDESLHIAHVGFCESKVKVVEVAENVPCTCTRNLKPVCASNGVTFTNECLMRCSGTHLTVEKDGPCEEY